MSYRAVSAFGLGISIFLLGMQTGKAQSVAVEKFREVHKSGCFE